MVPIVFDQGSFRLDCTSGSPRTAVIYRHEQDR